MEEGDAGPACELELELVHGEQGKEEVMVSDGYQKTMGK
jgi:hypothetical protein